MPPERGVDVDAKVDVVSLPLDFYAEATVPLSETPISIVVPEGPPEVVAGERANETSTGPLVKTIRGSLEQTTMATPPSIPRAVAMVATAVTDETEEVIGSRNVPHFFLTISIVILVPPSWVVC